MSDKASTAIAGAGLMGLVLAYRLSQRGEVVTVFEQAGQPGGLATYQDYGSFVWDRFYHVILPTDEALIGLLTELGFADSFFWNPAPTGYYADGHLYSLSGALDLARFPLLGPIDKLRMAAALLYATRVRDWRRLEAITSEEWLVRLFGRRGYERFWQPLLRAKLGSCYNEVSAVFIWTYIQRLATAARGRGAHAGCFGHVAGGYRAILSRLVDAIEGADGCIRYDTHIERIVTDADGELCVHSTRGVERFDRVVFTGPVNALEAAVSPALVDVNPGAVRYLGLVCMVLITRTPLCPYYTVNIADPEIPFTGVIGLSTVVPPAQTGGYYLTCLPRYVPAGDPFLSRTDEEVQALFLAGVRRIFPQFDPAEIVSLHCHRAQRVQPVHTLHYDQQAPKATTKHPRFFVLNTAEFRDTTLNNNSVVSHVDAFVKTMPPVAHRRSAAA